MPTARIPDDASGSIRKLKLPLGAARLVLKDELVCECAPRFAFFSAPRSPLPVLDKETRSPIYVCHERTGIRQTVQAPRLRAGGCGVVNGSSGLCTTPNSERQSDEAGAFSYGHQPGE